MLAGLDVLGRHVLWRTSQVVGVLLLAVGQQRQAEIGDLGLAVGGDHDVGGLEVAMDDAGLVRRADAGQHVAHDVHCLLDRQRLLEHGMQRFALDVFQHQVGFRLEAADIVDADDIAVLQLADRTRFLHQVVDRRLLQVALANRYGLDRDLAVEAWIVGQVNDTLGALAEDILDNEAVDLRGMV